jgi:uncharacterized protein (TIGR02646 family)
MSELGPVHVTRPTRRVVAEQPRYSLYRSDLREDFVQACGYCGDDDERADPSTFHIDHFAPKKQFPELTLAYANLVYACRFCNVSKSNHWIGTEAASPNDGARGFVDPCSDQYSHHLGRDMSGRITAKTPLGEYVIRRLRLRLIRHELLWKARKARSLRSEISDLIEAYKGRGRPSHDYAPLLERFYDLTQSIEDYELRALPR